MKTSFSILYDAIFLLRLQGKFDIEHFLYLPREDDLAEVVAGSDRVFLVAERQVEHEGHVRVARLVVVADRESERHRRN